MFTGIIESVQPIKAIRQVSGKKHVIIARPQLFTDLKNGSSIAVNGICLTVIEFSPEAFTVEIMNETLKKSTAGKWINGEPVNLERALQVGSRLDGHWVQGHVDTVSPLLETRTVNSTLYLTFELPSQARQLVVPQGSIAVNGVSLTISELKSERFTVALIGHTLTNTNLQKLSIGNKVNIEYDILGKYLQHKNDKNAVSLEFLNEQGF
jgi:riboflavin synthase